MLPSARLHSFEDTFDEAHPFTALMKQAHVAIMLTAPDTRFLRVNRRWLEISGYSEAEMLQMFVRDVSHPEDTGASNERLSQLQDGATGVTFEKRYVHKNGSCFWAHTTVTPLRGPEGKLQGFIALVVDLTAERQRRRLVESQNEALQLIISGAPLPQVFDRLIAAIEADTDGEAIGSVMLLDPATQTLRHGAAPSLPEEYNRAIDGVPARGNLGTCAAAAAGNQVVITPDINTAPGWQDLKQFPLALGLRAAWSMPIVSANGTVLGTLGTYFRRCRPPTPAEVETGAMLARTAALAIERSRSEQRLHQANRETDRQQRLYETVANNTPDLIYVFNLAHQFTYANKALLAMWGRTWDQAIGKTCLELGYEPWHAEMHGREIEQVVATRRPIRGEVAFNGTNGRRFYDYIFVPVMGANGEVEAVAGTTRDITEGRRAANDARFIADLTQQLTLLDHESAIVRHTVEAVGRHFGAHRAYFVECHENENVVTVGENWIRDGAPSLVGRYSLWDFGGPEWWRKYSGGDFAIEDVARHPLIGTDVVAAYTALGIHSYAVQPIKRTGPWTTVLAVTENRPRAWTEPELRLLDNVAARVWPLVERARSETALRTARDEALAASRAKDDFLAVLSHELRTPLNPVLLLASEASGNQQLPAEVRGDFETIVRHVTLEARLIDDLLDLTRITHNKLTLKPRRLDAHTLLRQVAGTLQAEMKEKRIVVDFRLAARASDVDGDEVRLQQVFWNLVRNAVKFTPAGGHVVLGTRNPEDAPNTLLVEVSDTGIGLTTAELARIFTPFAQGEHSETQGKNYYGGLGLGLAISHKIAELHGGRVTAHSPGRNRGATFLVSLPLAPARAEETAPERSERSAPPLSTLAPATHRFRRVLLVEDHEPSRKALARLLANRRIEVIQAGSVSEAVAQAAQQPFDLVLSDIGLPDGNGYDLMTLLQTQHGCRGIALSGYGTDKDIARSLEAGFMAHLTKPVQAQALDRMLETFGRT